MRPYVPPSTHPFSVNLYLSLIRVMVGGCWSLVQHLPGKERMHMSELCTWRKPCRLHMESHKLSF